MSRDQNLVDIETDKVVLEVVAEADGVIGEIIADEGTTVTAEEVAKSKKARVTIATTIAIAKIG